MTGAAPASAADVVTAVADLLRERYVFPDRAARAAAALAAALAAGRYGATADAALCAALTADLHAHCADLHLRVTWRDRPVDPATADAEARARYRTQLARRGHGVSRAQRGADGIAVVALTDVGPAEWIAPAVAAAFRLVAGCRALLLDLRENRGGTPDGAALICSYLLPAEPVLVNTVCRPDGDVRQYWSWPWLPAPRCVDAPVWVLTSARTFSGAEEIAYNLRALGRAAVVGERTRGGAHPVDTHWLTPHVALHLPFARSVNPVTGTNWEGTGVPPDVAVPAADAEATARRLAVAPAGAGGSGPDARATPAAPPGA